MNGSEPIKWVSYEFIIEMNGGWIKILNGIYLPCAESSVQCADGLGLHMPAPLAPIDRTEFMLHVERQVDKTYIDFSGGRGMLVSEPRI